MQVLDAVRLWAEYQKSHSKQNTIRTSKPRNRLILELMARGGMRVSEVLKPTPSDINERRLTLKEPKSGREQEFIFIPQRLADSFKDYIREEGLQPHQNIFPICYEAAREMVAKAILLRVFSRLNEIIPETRPEGEVGAVRISMLQG